MILKWWKPVIEVFPAVAVNIHVAKLIFVFKVACLFYGLILKPDSANPPERKVR